MVDMRVRAKITKNDECLFETVAGKPTDNNLKELITTLKETQHKVNEFLTTLVNEKQNDLAREEFDDLESGSDEESTGESSRNNQKKCKLSV